MNILKCLIAAVPALLAAHASAQGFPNRPVHVIVSFTAGSSTDIVGRVVTQKLSEIWGQPVVVENRAGAGGSIGSAYVVKQPPDGYTLLVGNISTNAINPSGFAGRLKFDPVKDLVPVTLVASVPTLLVTSPSLPPSTVKELIEYARARPGELNYSNPLGSYSHLDTLDLAAKQGIKVVLIPSKGAGSAITSIINGEVHFSFLTMSSVIPHVKAGRMKALATTSRERLPELPEVPTMAEAGFPGVGSENWNGLFFQAQTPRTIVSRLFAATTEAMARKPVHDAFVNASLPVTLSKSPEDFRAFVDAEVRRWARIVKDHDIHLE